MFAIRPEKGVSTVLYPFNALNRKKVNMAIMHIMYFQDSATSKTQTNFLCKNLLASFGPFFSTFTYVAPEFIHNHI